MNLFVHSNVFRYEYSFVSYSYHFFDTNIFGYSFVLLFLIRIYSDICSYHLFDMNIFGYSFVSFFGYKYIGIFVRIENLYSPHPGLNLNWRPLWFCLNVVQHVKTFKQLLRALETHDLGKSRTSSLSNVLIT